MISVDPRLTSFLALAAERPHPYYAYGAWVLASRVGDLDAVVRALRLGAADWRPEPVVRMRTEEDRSTQVIQLRLFDMEEAA